jgi:hypothetical protein
MSNSPGNERRRFHRFRFEGSVKLYSDRAMWDAELIDISLKGALTTRPADWSGKLNAMHRIELRLGDGLKISMGREFRPRHRRQHRLPLGKDRPRQLHPAETPDRAQPRRSRAPERGAVGARLNRPQLLQVIAESC